MKPKILLINDDGIEAVGLRSLYEALLPFAELSIVAPSEEQSGVGLSVTLRSPLRIDAVKWEKKTPAWKVNGTPADCVRLALNLIFSEPPDLIVSGINKGSNAGRNVLYSGTVGGVIEGVHRGVPGLAVSCEEYFHPDYEATKPYIRSIVKCLLKTPLAKGSLLNVNFPAAGPIQGLKLTRQGKRYVREKLDRRLHPEGNPYYWMGFSLSEHPEENESDISWLKKGFATAVPIHVDEMTDHSFLKAHKSFFEALSLE